MNYYRNIKRNVMSGGGIFYETSLSTPVKVRKRTT